MSYNITISSDQVLPVELTNMIYDKLEEIHKTYQDVTFTIRIATELGASVSTPSNPELPTRAYVDWITSKMTNTSTMQELKGKLDFEVKDWSKIKYMVKCHWGVKVTSEYPAPVIHEYYFEHFQDVQEFVNWYETENNSISKKIIRVQEVGKIFNVETYEVATKIRLV